MVYLTITKELHNKIERLADAAGLPFYSFLSDVMDEEEERQRQKEAAEKFMEELKK